MATKFAQFLTDNGIDPRRILSASRAIERLRPEDRQVRLQKRRARAEDATTDEKAKAAEAKRRSGRAVTERLLSDATDGKRVSAAAKTRLLRAVNRVLEQKKKSAVEQTALF